MVKTGWAVAAAVALGRLARGRADIFPIVASLARLCERRAFACLLKILVSADSVRSQAAAYYLRDNPEAIPALISVGW